MDKKEFLNSLSADERKELIAEMQQRERKRNRTDVTHTKVYAASS